MTLDEFFTNVKSTYGTYRAGMRVAIEKELNDCSGDNLQLLWDAIKKDHAGDFAPKWWEIKKIAKSNKISVLRREFTSVYLCGNCLCEFPIESSGCINPQCETKGRSLPATCPWCFRKNIITKFDDSDGVKLKCSVCGNIRTCAMIRRKVC